MNCDCIKRVESKLATAPFIVAKAGDNITAECQAVSLAVMADNSLVVAIDIPFRIRGTGKGFNRPNGKVTPCIASHCPFCGRTTGRYVIGEDAGIEAACTPGAKK